MSEDNSNHGARSNVSSELVDERTALLGSNSHNPNIDADAADIDPNEFDLLISRSESINGGLGIEIESQETPMLIGSRRYSSVNRRPSSSSITQNSNVIGEEDDEQDDDFDPKSPYLAGVGVTRFWLIFAGTLANYFVACFDSTIMVSSHPVITSYFRSANSASWLSTAFLLTSTAFQPLFGRLSDTIGRKPPYVVCLVVFLISTIWCGLAQSMPSFIAARAFCGLGAGGVMAMSSIIISDLVPIEIRGVYQSYVNITYGLGSILGAALGGAIADTFGWRWEFGIQIPGIALCLIGAIITVPKRLGLKANAQQQTVWVALKTFDYKGSILLTTAITCLILGLNLGGNVFPWTHPIVLTPLILFALSTPLFIVHESRTPLPIMPLVLLTQNPRAGLILSNFLGAIIANTITFNAPLFFQAVLLETPTSSGLHLLAPSFASMIFGTVTGLLITYTRRLKWPLVAGTILILLGTAGLTAMQRDLPSWTYLLFLIPSSMGTGFMYPGTFMAVLAVSQQAEQAVVTSTLVLWRSLGNVLGVAVSSLVMQNALLAYLNIKVVGPNKDEVIRRVRESVQAIPKLDPVSREQVIQAYALALRATFAMAAVLSVVALLLTVRLRLPRLGQRKT